jgi:hypothetical protein
MLWNETHRDVHPQPVSYDEIRDLTIEYAPAIKAIDSSAQILGPSVWGWSAYFWSALDVEPGEVWEQDRDNHGGTPFLEWYLQQMLAYEQQNGQRILDYLDIHYYPQAPNVSLTDIVDQATQALRLRSTRSLWDPNYHDESWIDDKVRLIPRMREWINTNYPSTKLAITEYNWGALQHINGALAQADVLGIFGREGLDMASLWGPTQGDDPWAFAFRLYRNYDNNGSAFGDISIGASSVDQDRLAVYAGLRSSDDALTVIVINKTEADMTSEMTLSGFRPSGDAQLYRYGEANLNAIEQEANQVFSGNTFEATYPASSVSLFIIRLLNELVADFGTRGLWHYNGGAWNRISTGNASGLSNYQGGVLSDFDTSGLYVYHGAWTRISTGNADDDGGAVAIGSDLYVDFGSSGLWKFDGVTWARISTGDAEGLETYDNKLVADLGSFGLYMYDDTWIRISAGDAEVMVAGETALYVDFGAAGLWKYDGAGTWARISTGNAEALEDYNNQLVADFGTSGLYLYDGSWTRISSGNAEGMISIGSALYVDFGPSGLWKFDGVIWTRISTGNAEDLGIFGNSLVADFGVYGFYEYDGSTWTRISTGNCEDMEDVDIY